MRVKGPGIAPGWQMPNPRVAEKLLKCRFPGLARRANASQLPNLKGCKS